MKKIVLVGGMPRSGTNLARRILGSHTDIAMPSVELMFFRKLEAGQSVKEILSADKFQRRYQLDVSDLYQESPEVVYRELLTRYAGSIGKPVAGEKSPRSEFDYARIRESLEDFDLRFVQIVRNPLDVAASYKHAPFRQNISEKEEFQPELIKLAEDWKRSLSIGLARSFSNPGNYHLLKYEDLTDDPENEIQALCDFIGVDNQADRMMNLQDFSEHKDNTSFSEKDVTSPSHDHGRVRAVKSRKAHLSAEELSIVVSLCAELAQSFGYDDAEFNSAAKHRAINPGKPTMMGVFRGQVKRTLGIS